MSELPGLEVGPEHPRELRLRLHATARTTRRDISDLEYMQREGFPDWKPGLDVAITWFKKRLEVQERMLKQAYEIGYVTEYPPEEA